MKQHLIPGAIAAAVAAAVAGGDHLAAPRVEQRVEQVTHEIAASKHAWPDLTDAQKSALARVLAAVPKGVRFDIVCNDAGCYDLAADIDDAMEAAGLDSGLDRSTGPLGYGIGIQVNADEMAAAEAAAAALRQATGLDLKVSIAPKGANPPGYVTILIGKHRP